MVKIMGKNKPKKHKKKDIENLHDHEYYEFFTPELKNSIKSESTEYNKNEDFKTNIVNENKSKNFDSIIEQIDRVIKSNDYEDVKKANYYESLDIALKVLNNI